MLTKLPLIEEVLTIASGFEGPVRGYVDRADLGRSPHVRDGSVRRGGPSEERTAVMEPGRALTPGVDQGVQNVLLWRQSRLKELPCKRWQVVPRAKLDRSTGLWQSAGPRSQVEAPAPRSLASAHGIQADGFG